MGCSVNLSDMSLRLAFLLLFSWLTALSPHAGAATILVHGDSLSAAYGMPRDQGWVNLLARRLDQESPGYRVQNTSMSGETTAGGLARIGSALDQHKPEIVIIELGANDGLRGWPLDVMKRNLRTMVETCRARGARVLLVGMQLPPNYGTAYTEKFHQVYRDLARELKVPLLPFLFEGFGERRDFFLPDGLHPAVQAQPLITDLVWKALEPLLKRKR